MEDNLISLLESLGYPVMRHGSLGENQAYPDTFLTFRCNSDDGHSFYETSLPYEEDQDPPATK